MNSPPPRSIPPVIETYMRDVDRTLLRENLKLTPHQRFVKFDQFMIGVMELHEAGRKHRLEHQSDRESSEQ